MDVVGAVEASADPYCSTDDVMALLKVKYGRPPRLELASYSRDNVKKTLEHACTRGLLRAQGERKSRRCCKGGK